MQLPVFLSLVKTFPVFQVSQFSPPASKRAKGFESDKRKSETHKYRPFGVSMQTLKRLLKFTSDLD